MKISTAQVVKSTKSTLKSHCYLVSKGESNVLAIEKLQTRLTAAEKIISNLGEEKYLFMSPTWLYSNVQFFETPTYHNHRLEFRKFTITDHRLSLRCSRSLCVSHYCRIVSGTSYSSRDAEQYICAHRQSEIPGISIKS